MVISKEILTDFKEVYEKAMNLVNEESKNDPPTDPFRSHYAARDLLLQIKCNLEDAKNNDICVNNGENLLIYKVIQSYILRDLGRIYAFTEEFAPGDKYLNQCINLIAEQSTKPEAIIPYVSALNELGIVYSNMHEYRRSHTVLLNAEKAFKEFKASNQNAMCITDVFGTRDEIEKGKGPAELERVYTLCTFYMAQVLGQLGELDDSANYCNLTLRRQMASKTYESIDFALNAATLSQYYIGEYKFREARHHLAIASLIMAQHEATMYKPNITEEQRAEITDTYKHRSADVARCWAKYGLMLLSSSKERLFNDDDSKLKADTERLNINEDYRFPNVEGIQIYENRITTNYCLTFDDAKVVFHFVINCLDKAQDYYKAENEATEYAKIIKDYAELYQYIAFFEEDPINQAKMQKRRAKYYEDLLELLNPEYYMTICRECWFGAGLAYCAILDIKLDAQKSNRSSSQKDIQKINTICQKAIQNYKDFVASYMDQSGKTLKPEICPEEENTVLLAYFHLGRLYYKMITPDLAVQLENMENSLKYYKLFTDECDIRKEAAKALQAEIGVCKEMVRLLPYKISAIVKRVQK